MLCLCLLSAPQEPHLLHEFEQDFYGEELRLVILAFIRPEANFTSLRMSSAHLFFYISLRFPD